MFHRRIVDCIFLIVVMMLGSLGVAVASDNTTTFENGPFTVSLDLGKPCNISISKPTQEELLTGEKYISYDATVCGLAGVFIWLKRCDKEVLDLNSDLSTDAIASSLTEDLMEWGADKPTIAVNELKIDGKPGAIGEGYKSELGRSLYCAVFIVSPRTMCIMFSASDSEIMKAAMNTIHVQEKGYA